MKWVEGRRENYGSTIHGRDHITYIEIAATKAGDVTGLRVKTFANLGGRLSTIGPGIPTTLYGRILAGPYKFPNVYCEVTGVYTNTTFVDAYRGAGRPEATYVVERAMDLFADEIGMDPAELRRRNFLPPDSFPVRQPVRAPDRRSTARSCTSTRATTSRRWTRRWRWPATPNIAAKKTEAKARGKLLGIGLSHATSRSAASRRRSGSAPSARAGAPRCGRSANIKVHLTGKIVVTMGTQPQGQGHETT